MHSIKLLEPLDLQRLTIRDSRLAFCVKNLVKLQRSQASVLIQTLSVSPLQPRSERHEPI